MLSVTDTAVEAIREIAPGEAGLRVYTAELPGETGQETSQVAVAQRPAPQDQVARRKWGRAPARGGSLLTSGLEAPGVAG